MVSRLMLLVVVFFVGIYVALNQQTTTPLIVPTPPPQPLWAIRSIDTMKYSRDIAREKADSVSFDADIETQIKNIAMTGASHVGIATPYDAEFVPFMTRWVDAARKHGLKVWFRGNFAGWEEWFDYPQLSREEHLAATSTFILDNPTLFEDGDLFTPCPECENGGPGDPRITGDVAGHRQFLIDTHNVATRAFAQINKLVSVGYHSMNYDVALLTMDRATTAKLGGIVTIDHYVKSPTKLNDDVTYIAELSGGKVFLGEYGAPIPDINGTMNQSEQAQWIEESLALLKDNKHLLGLSYWVNVGGSTQLWDGDYNPREAVDVVTKYYSIRQ